MLVRYCSRHAIVVKDADFDQLMTLQAATDFLQHGFKPVLADGNNRVQGMGTEKRAGRGVVRR